MGAIAEEKRGGVGSVSGLRVSARPSKRSNSGES